MTQACRILNEDYAESIVVSLPVFWPSVKKTYSLEHAWRFAFSGDFGLEDFDVIAAKACKSLFGIGRHLYIQQERRCSRKAVIVRNLTDCSRRAGADHRSEASASGSRAQTMAQRYARAKQCRRHRRMVRFLKTRPGIGFRTIGRGEDGSAPATPR